MQCSAVMLMRMRIELYFIVLYYINVDESCTIDKPDMLTLRAGVRVCCASAGSELS